MNSQMVAVLLRVAFVSVLMLGSSSAWGAWPPLNDVPQVDATGSNDVAVVVAIEDYLLLPDVPGAVANANEWELFLRSGMKVRDVHVLANQDATREAMLRFARTAAADVGEGGTLWWIFIGHGAPTVDGQDGMLVGMDAQPSVESLEARGLPQGLLLNTLQSSGHNTVMIVDASFSGRTADGSALAAGVQPVVAVDSAGTVMKNTVVLSAAKPSELAGSLDGAARPAFSYLMLGALRGWAHAGDGQVTAAEALVFSQRWLRKSSGRQQTPQIAGDVTLVLSRGVTEDKPRVVAEGIAAEAPVRDEFAPHTGAPSKSSLTLEYLQRRVVLEGGTARQAGRILDGPAFYTAIGRPELAAKWRSHKPVMWASGIALVAASSVFMGIGLAKETDGWIIAGGLTGGFGIMGGALAVVFGFVGERHPLSFAERRAAVDQHNTRLREERGLGPEVDWQNEPVRGGGPWGQLGGAQTPVWGFSLRF